jgi:hypothetical protein
MFKGLKDNLQKQLNESQENTDKNIEKTQKLLNEFKKDLKK